MEKDYKLNASIFKALSDPTRLKILDMLSCGELCACEILENVNIVQSTLSYHMKILIDSKLVYSKPNGSWITYYISDENITKLSIFLKSITSEHNDCICNLDRITETTCRNRK